MPLGTAKQNVTFFTFVTSTDMVECLHSLPDINYRGDLSVERDAEGNDIWILVINDFKTNRPTQLNLTARIGDVAIWDGINIHIITNAEFVANYTVV